jgi:urease accessory protein
MDTSALLAALQLGDSLFPSGAYTQSYGLESLVADELVAGHPELQAILEGHLMHRLAWADLPSLLAAHCAAARGDLELLLEIDLALTAVKLGREERQAAGRMGRRLLVEAWRLAPSKAVAWLGESVDAGRTAGNSAVAFGLAAQALALPADWAATVYAYSFAASLLSAAMRLTRIGHGQVQTILLDARGALAAAVERAHSIPWDQLRPCSPLLDIASARHQHGPAHLFAS